jgi:PAS domain S-box-containing protein
LAAFVDITARKQAEQELRELNIELEQRVLMRTAELSATNEHLLDEIEERAMVEEALRESDATTRLILDTSPDVIVITNKRGHIMSVNAQIKSLFGYEPNEVLGNTIESLIPQRYHELHVQHRIDYDAHPHRRPMGVGMELSGQRKNNSEFPVDVMLTPIRHQNISDWELMVTIRDSTERKQMEEEIRENQKRLQILSQRIVEVQEEERRAIARELHDRVGQSLAALSLNLTIINNQLADQASGQVNERLKDSLHLTKEVIALVRDVMANLRPAVLDDYGLEVALKANLDDLKSRYGLNIQFEKPEPSIPRLNPSVEMTLLRITQEAFLNIVRHAQADQVNLSLTMKNSTIQLMIQDNGIGIKSFKDANRPGSHGLTIMRERAEAVGGNLKISSSPGKGTQLKVSVPFQPRDRKEN